MPFEPGNPYAFRPGQSGNARGRPKGFATRLAELSRTISEATDQGAELVQFALDTLRDPEADRAARQYAHTWLSDRLWGKPVLAVELAAQVSAVQAPDVDWEARLARLSDEQVRALHEIRLALEMSPPEVVAAVDDDELYGEVAGEVVQAPELPSPDDAERNK